VKTLVVDDHVLIRDALRGVLRELKGDTVDILEASLASDAFRQLEQHPDVELVLLDLNLPDRDGLDALREIGARWPTVPVVVLSAFQDHEKVSKALELGAVGFIPKSARREVMCGAFNLIFAGGIYVPPEILTVRAPSSAVEATEARPDLHARAVALGLTERQAEVLALMMQGKSNKAICRALGLAESTVKLHVSAILRALNVSNRTEAVIAVRALAPLASPRSG
jgi:DNA-binding NarL/FixJ family response regulator